MNILHFFRDLLGSLKETLMARISTPIYLLG